VKCGPGTSRRSHTPDEYVDLPEVTTARAFYAEVVLTYLAEKDISRVDEPAHAR
jgi:acetylornithine deacetylase/succinyl-diaminopimelate desuccinylase-like protein